MSVVSRHSRPFAIVTALVVTTVGLALSPFGIAAASASNASHAASIESDINHLRTAEHLAPLNASNAFMNAYAKAASSYAAKHQNYKIDWAKDGAYEPTGPYASDNEPYAAIAKVPHGSATSVYDYVKTQIDDILTSTDFNYIGVGYSKHGSTVYAAIYLAEYGAGLNNLITEAKPKISGTDRVGARLTAKPEFTPSADPSTLTYVWKAGSTVLPVTTSTLVVPGSAYGKKITVTVRGSRSGYVGANEVAATLAATSSKTRAMKHGHLVTGAITVTGNRAAGQVLTAATTWGPAPVRLQYTWKRNGTTIAGFKLTNSPTYTQVTADEGKVITVKVTGSELGFTTATRTSTSKIKTTLPEL